MDAIVKALIDLKLAQLALSLIIWGAIAWLSINQQPVPDALLVAGTAVLAFWFGVNIGQRHNGGV